MNRKLPFVAVIISAIPLVQTLCDMVLAIYDSIESSTFIPKSNHFDPVMFYAIFEIGSRKMLYHYSFLVLKPSRDVVTGIDGLTIFLSFDRSHLSRFSS